MKYIAPDGHIMISKQNESVVYECTQEGMIEGTFESFETASANNQYGIQQIKIIRVVNSESVIITITESTDAELQAYISSVNNNPNDQEMIINLN